MKGVELANFGDRFSGHREVGEGLKAVCGPWPHRAVARGVLNDSHEVREAVENSHGILSDIKLSRGVQKKIAPSHPGTLRKYVQKKSYSFEPHFTR